MEHTKIEVEMVKEAISKASDAELIELTELQQIAVGGGSGEVVFG